MQDFASILSNFGFPVAVASYLLFRFEKKLEELAQTNDKLCHEIEDLKTKITNLNKIILELKRKKKL